MKKVNEIKMEEAVIVNTKASQKELALQMKETGVRHLFVLEKAKVKGLVSGTDLIHAIAEENTGTAEQIMSSELISVSPEHTAGQALKQMLKANQYSLPVVKNERLYGILTLTTCLGGLNDD